MKRVVCYDCGRRYGDAYGFPDLVVPNEVWEAISPTGDEGGLLCPSCMAKRCVELGIQCEAQWTSGPFTSSTTRNGLCGKLEGERCRLCGDPAMRKIAEELPASVKLHPHTTYLCMECFDAVFLGRHRVGVAIQIIQYAGGHLGRKG